MEELVDPLLKGKEVSTEGYSSEFSSVSERSLNVLGAYLRLIWVVKGIKGKIVPVETILRNTQTMLTDDTIKARDELWMQHCASSLREIVGDLLIPEDFICALKWLPSPTQEDGSPTSEYLRIRFFEDFFHAVAHFKHDLSIQKAKDIMEDTKITQVESKLFEKIVTKFIQELYNLFSENCMKNKRPSQ